MMMMMMFHGTIIILKPSFSLVSILCVLCTPSLSLSFSKLSILLVVVVVLFSILALFFVVHLSLVFSSSFFFFLFFSV